MTSVSVAEAKNNLSSLIERALAGEQVIITRHGHRVAELRPVRETAQGAPSHYALLKKERDVRPAIDITSVELLNGMYDEE